MTYRFFASHNGGGYSAVRIYRKEERTGVTVASPGLPTKGGLRRSEATQALSDCGVDAP